MESDQRNIALIHAILGALAAMLFVPLGVLTPRLARGWGPAASTSSHKWWLIAHATFNALGAAFVIAAFGYAANNFGPNITGNKHPSHTVRSAVDTYLDRCLTDTSAPGPCLAYYDPLPSGPRRCRTHLETSEQQAHFESRPRPVELLSPHLRLGGAGGWLCDSLHGDDH
jgi:hypothetical protein